MRVYLQAAQDVTVGARFAKTRFQYTLQDANSSTSSTRLVDKNSRTSSNRCHELRDVATDQQSSGTTLTLKIDRDMAFCATASSCSSSTIRSTTPSASGQQ